MTNPGKASSGTITILLFGPLAERVGRSRLEIDADRAVDVESLLAILRREYTALETAKFAVAVDEKIQNGNIPLTAAMTVALLPPFSGG